MTLKMAARTILSSLRTCFRTDYKPRLTYCQMFQCQIRHASATTKKAKATASVSKKKLLEVETDAKKLSSRLCGGNIYKEGEDPVLGADSDYPEWLWNLRVDKEAISFEELSQDDIRYWRKLKKLSMKHTNKLKGLKPRK